MEGGRADEERGKGGELRRRRRQRCRVMRAGWLAREGDIGDRDMQGATRSGEASHQVWF